MLQLLQVVVLDAVAEVVQFAGGSVSDVPQALVKSVGRFETGVGPQLDGGCAAFDGFGLDQVDQPAAEPLSSRRSGDVQLLQQHCPRGGRGGKADTGHKPASLLDDPEAAVAGGIGSGDGEQFGLLAVDVQDAARVLGPAAGDQADQVPGVAIAGVADANSHAAEVSG